MCIANALGSASSPKRTKDENQLCGAITTEGPKGDTGPREGEISSQEGHTKGKAPRESLATGDNYKPRRR